MNHSPNFTVRIRVEFPFGDTVLELEPVGLSREVFKSFEPLNRNHDVPFDFESAENARKQIDERRKSVKWLSEILADRILRGLTDNDPVRGMVRHHK